MIFWLLLVWAFIINKAAMNIHVQFMYEYVYLSFGQVASSEISGSHNKGMFNFIFKKEKALTKLFSKVVI